MSQAESSSSACERAKSQPIGTGFEVARFAGALVDVLNTKEALAHLRLPLDNPELPREQLVDACASALAPKKMTRKILQGMIKTYSQEAVELPGYLAALPENERNDLRALVSSDIQSQCFSDTVLVYTKIRSDAGFLPYKSIAGVLSGGALAMLALLACKIAVRGAIEIDAGTDAFQGELYGPILARLHYLESEVAQSPRIVVGEKMIGYLDWLVAHRPESAAEYAGQNMLVGFREMIVKDSDGVMVLDYLGPLIAGLRNETNPGGTREMFSMAMDFVKEELARQEAASCDKLIRRYQHVLGDFRRVID